MPTGLFRAIASSRLLWALLQTHRSRTLPGPTFCVPELRAHRLGAARRATDLPPLGSRAPGGILRCPGGNELWARSPAWAGRGRLLAASLEPLADQSRSAQERLWSATTGRTSHRPATLESVAAGRGFGGGDVAVSSPLLQAFAPGRLCLFATGSVAADTGRFAPGLPTGSGRRGAIPHKVKLPSGAGRD